MKIVIKGGSWRNSEDEILKAAISKYGKNQWARISSLLSRKTPKQCKARWYEWLDPSIKKTEWSKEEDEKLLHLAKLMPTQWRTIAPVVGRTANQCLERYQRLLDEAEQREAAEVDGEDLGLMGTGGEAGPSADDVRKLRPGEVDPDPEAKPARPDPIDMDEDEKEMLSEARARLANTQGKKAKRKARERQLEEARRLAMLQKKRELKAAGIMMRMKPKKGGMDYNADIPFEKKPAPGFYDTTDEKNKRIHAPVGKTLRQLDTQKRTRAEDEDQQRKKAKAKQSADKDAAAHFVPAKDSAIRREKEEENILKRRKLMLPEPQVGESELEEIVKIGQAGESARELVDDGGEGASGGLLGEYSALQHAQNARTPRTPATNDNIMAEARNLRNMTMSQTPLLGEANTPLHELSGRGTGFDGATPARQASATPNPLATPMYRRDVGATPRGEGAAPGATPMRTPMRDNLSINPEGSTPRIGETPREIKMRQNDAKRQLQQGFLSLPKPKNDFELVLPEEEQERIAEMVVEAVDGVEDAADREARIKAVRVAEEAKALARRSQAIKRGLPRPIDFDHEAILKGLEQVTTGEMEVERLVAMEMVELLMHDAIVYPVAGGKQPGGGRSNLAQVPDNDVAAARALVHSELASSAGLPGVSEEALKRVVAADSEEFASAWSAAAGEYAFDAESRCYVPLSSLSDEQRKSGLAALLEDSRAAMLRDATLATKLEKRLGKTLGGYQARSGALGNKLITDVEDLNRSTLELANFARLAINEDGAAGRRVEAVREEVQKLERREREGQMRYKELNDERLTLLSSIEEMQEELIMREAEAANEAATAMEE